jgi:PAS domain S-box-containing protein
MVIPESIEPPESATEARHLRRLLEKQPACLLRVGLDGLLLAANDAALSLLGAEALPQVLGRHLTDWISEPDHTPWDAFAARIREGASSSLECDVTDPAGGSRTLLFQGVPLLDHADGLPSMILSARDTSSARRLETAVREREISRELGDLQKQLDGQVFAERRRADAPPPEWAARQQALTDDHQRALSALEQESRQQLDTLRGERDAARAEQQRLTALGTALESDQQHVLAAQAAERAQLQQMLADDYQRALRDHEHESQRRVDALHAERDQAVADRERLTTLLDERDADHQRVLTALDADHQHVLAARDVDHRHVLAARDADHQLVLTAREADHQRVLTALDVDHQRVLTALDAEQAQRQQTLADEHQDALLRQAREAAQRLDAARTELAQARAEQERLTEVLDARERANQDLVAETDTWRAEVEQHRTATAREQARLEKALADQRVEERSLEENVRHLEELATAGRAALAIGAELQTVLDAVDARTQHLLTETATEAADRHVIEALREDAIEAASLTRQILQATAPRVSDGGGSE